MVQPMDWLPELSASIPGFLQTLAVPDLPGRYLPCRQGLTRLGRQVDLGFSCFGLKLHIMLGLWDQLGPDAQSAWVRRLKSFQVAGDARGDPVARRAFLDPVVAQQAYAYWRHPIQLVAHTYANARSPRAFLRRLHNPHELAPRQRAIIAETKQAIATLAEAGETPDRPYQAFPTTADALQRWLEGLDWTRPWGAGGQAAALAVFLSTQAPRFLPSEQVSGLQTAYRGFIDRLADSSTGAYFRGGPPGYGELVNGAMKVLTGLDWLGFPIHYPGRLIDTCLSQLPPSDGCHLVDATYVLYRCLQQTDHRRGEVEDYCRQLLEQTRQHYNPDGGFSYYIGRSQTSYYGVRISHGLPVSDLHGTILLTWAVVMIRQILEQDLSSWRVIKP